MTNRSLLLVVATIAVAIALLFVRPHATPGPLMRDFEAYHAAGATWDRQGDPYGRDIWSAEAIVPGVDPSRDEMLPFVGPPFGLPIWGLLARLPYANAVRIWSLVLTGALIGTILLTLRVARIPLTFTNALAAAALAIGFAPMTSDLALGQVALLSFFAALVAVVSVPRNAALATIATVVAGLQPNVALPLVVLAMRRRGLAILGAALLVAFALGAWAWAYGAQWPLAYTTILAHHGAAEVLAAIQHTPAAIAFGFGALPSVALQIGRIVAIAVAIFGILAITRLRSPQHRFVVACALVPFVSGFFHEHDFLVTFAAALWCARLAKGPTRAFALLGTVLVAIDWLGLAQRTDGVAQSALLASAAVCGFLVLGEERPQSALTWAPLLLVAALFTGAAMLAHAYPAPIWPDAMGAYHASIGATLAQIWNEEQVRTGLLVQVPAWAALRMLPLVGCALLAVATAKSAQPESI